VSNHLSKELRNIGGQGDFETEKRKISGTSSKIGGQRKDPGTTRERESTSNSDS